MILSTMDLVVLPLKSLTGLPITISSRSDDLRHELVHILRVLCYVSLKLGWLPAD